MGVRTSSVVVALALVCSDATPQAAPPRGAMRPAPAREAQAEPTVIADVSDAKALGYVNNRKFITDARGTAFLAVRTKGRKGPTSICLFRSAGPWTDASRFDAAWLEDRPGVEVSSAAQRPASIAATGDGSVHVAWYGGSASVPAHQIRYARFASDGELRLVEEAQPFFVAGFERVYGDSATGDELWQEHPCLAARPDGSLFLVWEARDTLRRNPQGMPQPAIAWAVRGADGTWSSSGPIGAPPYAQVDARFPSQSRPTLVPGAGGEMHVLCYGSVGGIQQILYGRFEGRTFSGWTVPCPSPNDQRHVSAALDPAGRLHLAWREGPPFDAASGVAIEYASLDARGRVEGPVRVSPPGENASTPSLVVGGGSVWIAWVGWPPGEIGSEGKPDNGYPSDNATVEGKLEACSRKISAPGFGPIMLLDAGPAAYPTWAVRNDASPSPEALVWTQRVPGGDGLKDQIKLVLARVGTR